jgi:hypothetical protein
VHSVARRAGEVEFWLDANLDTFDLPPALGRTGTRPVWELVFAIRNIMKWEVGLQIVRTKLVAARAIFTQAPGYFSAPLGLCVFAKAGIASIYRLRDFFTFGERNVAEGTLLRLLKQEGATLRAN